MPLTLFFNQFLGPLCTFTLPPGPCLARPEWEQGCRKSGPCSRQTWWHSHVQPLCPQPSHPGRGTTSLRAGAQEQGCLLRRTRRVRSKQGHVSHITSITRTNRQRRVCAPHASVQLPRQTRGCRIIWLNVSVPNSLISDCVFIVL